MGLGEYCSSPPPPSPHSFFTRLKTRLVLFKAVGRFKRLTGEQGWRSGESARLPPMWPGFKSPRRRHMWVEVVVGSERFFSGYSGFPLSPKTNTSKFQFDLERTDTEKRALKLLGASWVNKLHLHLHFIDNYNSEASLRAFLKWRQLVKTCPGRATPYYLGQNKWEISQISLKNFVKNWIIG